jgi:site-specific recombinase XerD
MFEVLFSYPKVLARHQTGPAAVDRERYLAHCADLGAAHGTLLRIARELLVIAERIDVTDGNPITLSGINVAARAWARQQKRQRRAKTERWSRYMFAQVATVWVRFLGKLEDPPRRERGALLSGGHVDEFIAHLRDERGLSPNTIGNRRWQIEGFLDHVSLSKASIASLTVTDIDAFLEAKGREDWCRVSVATCATALRSFFRYAEKRRWCRPGIAAAIDAPRLFKQEGLPRGPRWTDVQRLIDSTSGCKPRDVRDRAILMLLAIYGLRGGEVRGLRLEDLDWGREVITIKRPKQRKMQYYPIVESVGTAILNYLQWVRPRRCASRDLFVTLKAPFGRLSPGGLHHVVSSRLQALGIETTHYGPHGLRHACAAHLVAEGLSLKEIGDHLGHRSAYATRTYARVDLTGLREVADFDLGGLL